MTIGLDHLALSSRTDPTAPSLASGSTSSQGAASRPDLVKALNGVFCAPEVFGDACDDIAHVKNILKDRRQRPDDEPSSQLAFLCDRYVQRFGKRMSILQKRGGERRESILAERHWAARLKAFLNRPFASRLSLAYYCIVSLLVVASCISLVVQTIPSYNPVLFADIQDDWNAAELTFAGLLFADWMLRFIAVCFEPLGRRKRSRHVLTFLRQPATILDFCASAVPALLTFSGDSNSVFQIFTLLRVFRIFFSLRHFDAFEDLEDTIRSSLPSLTGPLIALAVVLIGVSSLVYTMESGSYNEETYMFMVRQSDCEMTAAFDLGMRRCFRTESKFLSVVHTMWYTLITFLTVGYGDLVPVTASGRGLGAASIVVGMLFMAMPIAIVGTNFTFTVDRLRTERHCVARMMDEAGELQQMRKEVDEAIKAKTRDIALPSQALLRFLRLNLRQTHVDLATASRRLTYFVDVYLARVVDALLSDKHADLAAALAARSVEQRRPYNARLELTLPSHIPRVASFPQVRHSINLPLTLGVGVAPRADLSIPSEVISLFMGAQAAKIGPTQAFGALQVPGRRNKELAAKESAISRVPVPFVAPIHSLLTLVGYGGTADTLGALGVDPYTFTLLDANMRECTNLAPNSSGGFLVFGRVPANATIDDLKDLVHLRIGFGAPLKVFDRASEMAS